MFDTAALSNHLLSESELLYDWGFTANQLVVAGSLCKPLADSIEDTPHQGSISRVQQSVASETLL
jgi:hypothetical protein